MYADANSYLSTLTSVRLNLFTQHKGVCMEIRILGPGCPRCDEVAKRTLNLLAELNIAADFQKITDLKAIAQYNIIATPGLVINGTVKCAGRIPSAQEIRKWLEEESTAAQ
jgi:small redox-active disulfide protein 2